MNTRLDCPKKCPVCQQANHCNVSDINQCWCLQTAFNAQRKVELAKKTVTESSACLCFTCATTPPAKVRCVKI